MKVLPLQALVHLDELLKGKYQDNFLTKKPLTLTTSEAQRLCGLYHGELNPLKYKAIVKQVCCTLSRAYFGKKLNYNY